MGRGQCPPRQAFHFCLPEEKSVNSHSYCKVLQRAVKKIRKDFGGRHFRFQQDNAKPHTSKFTTAWFETAGLDVMDWPANSADLSPIENIFGLLKPGVDARAPTTYEQLAAAVRAACRELDNSVVQATLSSCPGRLQKCIAARGGATGC